MYVPVKELDEYKKANFDIFVDVEGNKIIIRTIDKRYGKLTEKKSIHENIYEVGKFILTYRDDGWYIRESSETPYFETEERKIPPARVAQIVHFFLERELLKNTNTLLGALLKIADELEQVNSNLTKIYRKIK